MIQWPPEAAAVIFPDCTAGRPPCQMDFCTAAFSTASSTSPSTPTSSSTSTLTSPCQMGLHHAGITAFSTASSSLLFPYEDYGRRQGINKNTFLNAISFKFMPAIVITLQVKPLTSIISILDFILRYGITLCCFYFGHQCQIFVSAIPHHCCLFIWLIVHQSSSSSQLVSPPHPSSSLPSIPDPSSSSSFTLVSSASSTSLL